MDEVGLAFAAPSFFVGARRELCPTAPVAGRCAYLQDEPPTSGPRTGPAQRSSAVFQQCRRLSFHETSNWPSASVPHSRSPVPGSPVGAVTIGAMSSGFTSSPSATARQLLRLFSFLRVGEPYAATGNRASSIFASTLSKDRFDHRKGCCGGKLVNREPGTGNGRG